MFVCPNCLLLVVNSHHSSHEVKCSHSFKVPIVVAPSTSSDAVIDPPWSLPSLEEVFHIRCNTIRYIPSRDRQAFAQVLSSNLSSVIHENTEQAWLKLFMLPKCVLSPKRRGRRHKAISVSQLCNMWSRGEFKTLWKHVHSHSSSHSLHQQCNTSSDNKVYTAVSLARDGLFSKACQVLLLEE